MLNGIFLATLAGCATGLGALPVLWIKSYRPASLAAGMSLAAGVMCYLTFVEIFPEVTETFERAFKANKTKHLDYTSPKVIALALSGFTFFAGWFLADFLNRALHVVFEETPRATYLKAAKSSDEVAVSGQAVLGTEMAHLRRLVDAPRTSQDTTPTTAGERREFEIEELADALADESFRKDHLRLLRVGWFTALALSMHNLPEGIATYTGAATANSKLALGITFAIGIHNLPEGLAVAIPIYYSIHDAKYAILVATLTGMAEPLGAVLAWAVLGADPSPMIFGILLGLVSGIMINVSLKELFFGAARYDPNDRISSVMFVLGMALIAVSLVVLELVLPPSH
eukprot:Blabericola_migrator_1__8771@NODE_461_length_8293_cov_107_238877_g360_i0_p4_GENE_NODE_461_length_8293_cov_107_238877_g360_i0NODE_461_length_8293_cov_107_238877_g360_i0_p4_ORF_typecomplete_len342_score60_68Zip/PF02535_22/3_1e43DUF2721/PF11026_8/3e03DUF2721/PF11026_8/3_5e03DUF2721/PF11026_8/0_13_NODE_461_length_8293_cov_107_238877_g360_i017372762